jgi:hypothetical protein
MNPHFEKFTNSTINQSIPPTLNNVESITMDDTYDKLRDEDRVKLIGKVDNFLEALYLAPHLFGRDVIQILRFREEKLTMWRQNGQFVGGLTYLSFYLIKKLRNPGSGFYFRNFGWMTFYTFLFSYLAGRGSEYFGNKLYYEKILFKLAGIYNVTDDEIEEFQYKLNEQILNENKNDQIRAGSLDSVKFRV